MSYFYKSVDKDATKAFIYEDLKVLGIKLPKLDKITKASSTHLQQQQVQQQVAAEQQIEGKCSESGTAVFGVPLALMDAVEDVNIGHIPQFLVHTRQFLSQHLDREGLFRKTGSVSRQKDLALQIEENGGEGMDDAQVYDVTSVVKQFFRGLPEPLIPHILQDAFIQAVQLNLEDSKVYSLALLCLLLPSEHLSVFRYTLEILSDVSSNAKVNKMTAHNLAVCLTPNLFHTKQSSKQLDLQTEAMKLCIDNVINIGVVPPSITEKVVMLRSLEANQMENSSSLENSAVSGSSIRKKKRSGSLHGIVGSIRRSVERMRSRTSRRSSSVPDDLNTLERLDTFNHREGSAMDIDDSCGATPQIMRKSLSGETSAFSLQKRKAIVGQSSFLGTPLAKMSLKCQSADNVFESPTQNSMLSNQTAMSMNSTKAEDSKISTPGKKKSWAGLRSPFNKRKRSLSAGPALSPRRARSSNRTKKLIRRLSGGKRKTPDMVGQRLAFSNEEDVASVRRRMPSAPTSLSFGCEQEGADMCNEEFISNLRADLVTGSKSAIGGSSTSPELECHPLTRMHTCRESRRPKATIRRRAKSADNRALRRGKPNHPLMGLNKVKTRAIAKEQSNSSLYSDITEDRRQVNAPLDTTDISTNVLDQSPPSIHTDSQPDLVLRERRSRSRVTSHTTNSDMAAETNTFDRRMAKIASVHGDLFSKPPVPRQQSAGRSTQRSATFSHCSRTASDRKPPKPDRLPARRKQETDGKLSVVSSHPSSQTSVAYRYSDSGLRSSGSSVLGGSDSKESSKSSLVSADSGISEGGKETAVDVCNTVSSAGVTMRNIEERVVIGGNDPSCSQLPADDNFTGRVPKRPLTVMGAQLQTITHANSISNLHEVSKVKQSKRFFDQPISSGDAQSSEPISDEMASEKPLSIESGNVVGKPPRQAPVRIPTVFAKNDPRAMRYKMAADAVRRRSIQKSESVISGGDSNSAGTDSRVLSTDFDCSPVDLRECAAAQGVTSVYSMKVAHSPPPRKTSNTRGLSPLPHSRQQGSQATAYIPISTDIVRGVATSPLRKVLTSVVTTDRLPLRDHSPNIDRHLLSTPKIKSAMLPLDHVKSANRQHSSRKSPRTRIGSQPRLAPYSTTTPNRSARGRVTTSCTLKDTAL